ncbi:MAG: hypothetical protein U0228_15095 [Myxococcaceae bacterium]
MAAKKKATAKQQAAKTAPVPVLVPNRALEHGEQAYGARFKRPGFALTPELDLAFALGHGSAMGPATLLPDLPVGKVFKGDHHAVPRNVAIAVLRKGIEFGKPIPPHDDAPTPIDEAEVRGLVLAQLPRLNLPPVYFRALEAMVGPSAVLAAYLEGLEKVPAQSWDTGSMASLWPTLYGLLLRTPPGESNAACERLEALYLRHRDQFASAGLDILLHGREAIARRGYKYSTKFKSYQRNDSADPSNVLDLCYCDGDGEWVASQFEALWAAFKFKPQSRMADPSPARLFFLGGEAALETELKVVAAYPGTMQADALASYADLKGPLVVKLVKALATGKSKVKKQADAWLTANA